MIGLDASYAVLQRAQVLQREQGLPLLKLVHSDAQNLPFLEKKFDLVLARHMLYHVPDIPRAIREIARVLKTDGLFMASTNSMYSRPELNRIHTWNLTKFPSARFIDRGSARFGSENGAKILHTTFNSVYTLPWFGHIDYDTTEQALKYYLSTVYFQNALPTEKEKTQLKDMVAQDIQSIIDQEGYFRVTSWGAIFFCQANLN